MPQQQFAIASHLLGQAADDLNWSNLGYWCNTNDYITACQQLAEQVGLAAQLHADDRVLELACGQGASLTYWPQRFNIRQLYVLELQAALVQRIQQQSPAALQLIAQGRFDNLPLAAALEHELTRKKFDAVLCVDAAYHASSLHDFASTARHCLHRGGRLAFTTLTLDNSWFKANYWQKKVHAQLLNAADVPIASLLTTIQLQQQLAELGFANIRVQHMDDEVLTGFASFVSQRAAHLSLQEKLQPEWLKIAITARLCRYLRQHGLVHYSLVSAQLQ